MLTDMSTIQKLHSSVNFMFQGIKRRQFCSKQDHFLNGIIVSDIRGFQFFGKLLSGLSEPDIQQTLRPKQLWQDGLA